jgi:Bacterial Ig-like domain (group 3)/IPT/TIG domain
MSPRSPFLLRVAGKVAPALLLIVAFVAQVSLAIAAPPRCPSTVTGSLASVSTTHTTGRLTLDGASSVCGTTKAFPGANPSSIVRYTTLPYENRSTADACVQVSVTATSGEVETAAYLSTFTATNPAAAYLGDPGGSASALAGSTQPTQSYSINVPALGQFLVMVQETALGAGGTFSVNVTNCGAILTTGISPAYGPVTGGQAVMISGTGFVSGATVTVGGTALTNVTVVSDGSLTGTTAAHAAGLVDVVVTDGDGTQSTLPSSFTYLEAASSSVQVALPAGSSVFGQPVTLTASLSGTNPPATVNGAVIFEDGTTPLGNPMYVNAIGQATLTTSSLSVGTHAITVVYDGTALFEPSTSSAVSFVVTKAETQTTLVSAYQTWSPGFPLTFTATVSVLSPGVGTPTGTVQFVEAGSLLGTGTLDSTGTAAWTAESLSVGNHVIYADYGGDSSFDASTGSTSEAIEPGTANETLTSSAPTAVYGAAITFTASLAEGSVVPTGTVTFSTDGAQSMPIAVDASGQATWTLSGLTAGTHTVTASYSGDANDQAAQFQMTQIVTTAPTVTSIASSQNPATTIDLVAITATVTAPGGGGPPTGSVQFTDSSVANGPVTVSLVGGVASYTLMGGSAASHSIVASYLGDTNFQGSASGALVETIAGVDAGAGEGTGDAGVDASAPSAEDAGPVGVPEAGTWNSDDAGDSGTEPLGLTPDESGGAGACGCRAAGGAPTGSLGVIGFAAVVGALKRRRRR